ncbi:MULTISPECIES: tetratricopeptide repeat-containing protein [spotted fever group]|uniref:tetratricopeptide repeat-containing protein n=1 Tax=spotted fever group TaxID=114277 RepID=UPI0001A60875|nr:tetratricopeptide repeat-containing protein [Rickettsia endosymbiont of Ixodes scapularis]EER22675.1 tetratricopeptide repeat-containing protein [Rickettsia endosymbiont of Ixodes scapularis]
MKELIEFLEKRGLKWEADSLRKGGTTLSLSYNNIGDTTLKTINGYLQRNKTIAEKKAESLNAEGNNLCSQEKYDEAIEKYKAAIKIKKGLDGYSYRADNLYEKNKTNAEKEYKEQQKQVLSAKNINIVDDNLTKFLLHDNFSFYHLWILEYQGQQLYPTY